jgi:hypothetical protein
VTAAECPGQRVHDDIGEVVRRSRLLDEVGEPVHGVLWSARGVEDFR